ncbi:SufE family protein [Compostibacter hankyongensis]|uniref:SufE family protein n=1 Tax=Compostibacter hankyongensis TaxID=1007089 RepID=A0ABP8FU60_9BACT
MDINRLQDKIIEEFDLFLDKMNRFRYFRYITRLGKELPLIDTQYKTEQHLIRGCNPRVWLHAAYQNDKVFYTADGDTPLDKGLLSMFIQILSGHSPKEIANADMYVLNEIRLHKYLPAAKFESALSILKQIKLYAVNFQVQSLFKAG